MNRLRMATFTSDRFRFRFPQHSSFSKKRPHQVLAFPSWAAQVLVQNAFYEAGRLGFAWIGEADHRTTTFPETLTYASEPLVPCSPSVCGSDFSHASWSFSPGATLGAHSLDWVLLLVWLSRLIGEVITTGIYTLRSTFKQNLLYFFFVQRLRRASLLRYWFANNTRLPTVPAIRNWKLETGN